MAKNSPESVTQLLQQISDGDQDSAERLLPLVYDELRALAGGFFRAERPDHTLQPTALVHEAFLRLLGQDRTQWANRAHFLAIAASAMRRILVDHARARRAAKRRSHGVRVTLDHAVNPTTDQQLDMLDLDAALGGLSELDERKARVVELRFFGGLTNDAVAQVLGVSRKTIVDDWTVARLWLQRELAGKSER